MTDSKVFHTQGYCPKVNLIVRLEFELVYCDDTIQHVRHNAMGIPSEKETDRLSIAHK